MVDVDLNWINWFHPLSLEGGLLIILIDYMISLSLFLDVKMVSLSTVSFLAQLDSGFLPIEWFPLTYDLNGFKSRINGHLSTVGSFLRAFLYALRYYATFKVRKFELPFYKINTCLQKLSLTLNCRQKKDSLQIFHIYLFSILGLDVAVLFPQFSRSSSFLW